MSTLHPGSTLVAFPTKLGWMALMQSARAVKRLALGYPTEEAAITALKPDIFACSRRDCRSEPLAERLQAYASGHCDNFLDVQLDWGRQTEFQTRVYHLCRHIPFGETLTYGELAAGAGSPGAARAVGRAMATNRIPLLVPCHRVVPSGGGLGGFSAPGGITLKRQLLDLETGCSSAAGQLD